MCGGSDCNDDDPTVNPDAAERCGDGIDNDCDGLIDFQDSCVTGADTRPPDVIEPKIEPPDGAIGTIFSITAKVVDSTEVMAVKVKITSPSGAKETVTLYDDGGHNDGRFADNVYGNVWDSDGKGRGNYTVNLSASDLAGNTLKINIGTVELIGIGQKCEEVVPGHNKAGADRLNLVFAGINYQKPEDVKKLAEFVLDLEGEHLGLFSLEPFKSNKERFNFWYVNETVSVSVPSIYWGELPVDKIVEIREKTDELLKKCVLSNKYMYRVYNLSGPDNAVLGVNGKVELFLRYHGTFGGGEPQIFVHESVHLIGELYDEYVRGGGKSKDIALRELSENKNNLWVDYDDFRIDEDTTLSECIQNAHWNDIIGDGCGEDGVVDCIQNLSFMIYKLYFDSNHNLTKIKYVMELDDRICDISSGSCIIQLNSTSCDILRESTCFEQVPCEAAECYLIPYISNIYCYPDKRENCNVEIYCFEGASSYLSDVFRSAYNTIMKTLSTKPYTFGLSNIRVIQERLDRYEGE
jgi:hypothetical protein